MSSQEELFPAYPRSRRFNSSLSSSNNVMNILLTTIVMVVAGTALVMSSINTNLITSGKIGGGGGNCTSDSFNLTMICDGQNCTLVGDQPGCNEIDLYYTDYHTVENITHLNQTIVNTTLQYLNQTIVGNLTELFPNGTIPPEVSVTLHQYNITEQITQYLNQSISQYNNTYVGNFSEAFPGGLPEGNLTVILNEHNYLTQVNETVLYYNVTSYGNISEIFNGTMPDSVTVITNETVTQNFNYYDVLLTDGNYTDLFPNGAIPAHSNITLHLQNNTYVSEVTQYVNETIQYVNQTIVGNLTEIFPDGTLPENVTVTIQNNTYNSVSQTIVQQTVNYGGSSITACDVYAPQTITVDPAATVDSTNNNCTTYLTIQSAINSLMNKRLPVGVSNSYFTKISIAPGTYNENIYIPNSVNAKDLRLRIIGDNRPIAGVTFMHGRAFAPIGVTGGRFSKASVVAAPETVGADTFCRITPTNTGAGGALSMNTYGLTVGDVVVTRASAVGSAFEEPIAVINDITSTSIRIDINCLSLVTAANVPTITFVPNVVIYPSSGGHVFTVASNKVHIQGIWMRNLGSASSGTASAVIVEPNAEVDVRGCTAFTYTPPHALASSPSPSIVVKEGGIFRSGGITTEPIGEQQGIAIMRSSSAFDLRPTASVIINSMLITDVSLTVVNVNPGATIAIADNLGLNVLASTTVPIAVDSSSIILQGPVYVHTTGSSVIARLTKSTVSSTATGNMLFTGASDVGLQVISCPSVLLNSYFSAFTPSGARPVGRVIDILSSEVHFSITGFDYATYVVPPKSFFLRARDGSRVHYYGSDKDVTMDGTDVTGTFATFELSNSYLYAKSFRFSAVGPRVIGVYALASEFDVYESISATDVRQFLNYQDGIYLSRSSHASVSKTTITLIDRGADTTSCGITAGEMSRVTFRQITFNSPGLFACTQSGGVITSHASSITSSGNFPSNAVINVASAISTYSATANSGQIYIFP